MKLPENVKTDIALQIDVGMVDHRLTFDFWGVMGVSLAHLETKHKPAASVKTLQQ
jgi:hypothetical protein